VIASPFVHIVEYISPAKMLRFVIICNYPRRPHVSAAIWPWSYMFTFVWCSMHSYNTTTWSALYF